MSGTIKPIHELTPEDHGAVVTVSCLICIITLVPIIAARVWIAVRRKLLVRPDDVLFALAAMLAFTQSGLVMEEANNGLGKHWSSLRSDRKIAFLKLSYSAQLIGTLSMACAKGSVPLLYLQIARPLKGYRYHYYMLMVAIWALFAFLAQAFACRIPRPWDHLPSDCSTQFSLDYAVIFANLATDAVLAIAFLPVIWCVKSNRRRRVTIMALFASRLFVPAGALAQLIVLARTRKNSDPSWNFVTVTIMNQVVIYLSTITACIPRIHHFLYHLQTGQMGLIIGDYELVQYMKTRPTANASPTALTNTHSRYTLTPLTRKPEQGKVLPSRSDNNEMRSHMSESQSSLVQRPQDSTHKPPKHIKISEHRAHLMAGETAASASSSGKTNVNRLFRPRNEPINTYEMEIFSPAVPSVRVTNNSQSNKAHSHGSELEHDVVYETKEFRIKYPDGS